MKKIIIVGGLGTIGQMIYPTLAKKYNVTIFDIIESDCSEKVDACNYEQLIEAIPEKTDIIINLISIKTTDGIIHPNEFDHVTNTFFKASYNILHAAAEKNIKKVIYASSNHVADFYEDNGNSKLGREITTSDYPYSKGLYGVLKLASENIGHAFAQKYGLSVINLRIGSVRLNENKEILADIERFKKTWLSEVDVVSIFEKSIATPTKYGTYFAVSNNPEKPWSIENTEKELDFQSLKNTIDILKEGKYD